ncbi:MAG: 3'-5' exonuclease, partial [Candidatus Binatia bacterium]|nr:3'-5' exonuclease [Candidatus Binatia bacterium]
LAERSDRRAGDWRKVGLTPGKIFVVGDPKQSIYAFRRADIEAYLEVVQNVIKKQGGVECNLTTNFRSHGGILNFVNASFEKLIHLVPGLQPSYVAIQPAREGGGEGSHGNTSLPFRTVAIRRVVPEEGEINAEIACQMEAESLARWLAEEVLDRAEILDREGRPVVVRAKDVAILLRKLTDLHHYLEPLRRRGIRYVVEGEKHFYAAQEIVDAVNLLRAVENPYDRAALVGLLRSPIGGLKDAEIYRLHRRSLLDYRRLNRLDKGVDAELGKRVRELFGMLHKLHEEIRQLPVGEAVTRVFAALPMEVLAARSFHGEQAIANLEKIRRQAETLGREGSGTLKEVISLLQRRVLELKEEAEGALAEETVDAVRILSVHKSKGLEFPVVVLAGCQSGTRNADGTKVKVYPDWSTQLVGLRINELSNLSGVFLEEKAKLREDEEQKRVLYVAATRAREHLSISCAGTRAGGSGSFVSMLERAIGDFTSSLEPKVVLAGSREIEVNVVTARLEPPDHVLTDKGNESPVVDWSRYRNFWKRRDEIYREGLRRPLFVTPSSLKKREEELAEEYPDKEYRVPSVEKSILIGNLAHRFLQDWDFSMKRRGARDGADSFLRDFIKGLPEPVPDPIQMELAEIFQIFFMSSVYEELRTSEILGREVPLIMPWDGQVMEGVIDVIYEKEGHLYVADYKTDKIERKELSGVAKGYHYQAEIYSEAVRRVLRRDVSEFKLIFLRLGEALQV